MQALGCATKGAFCKLLTVAVAWSPGRVRETLGASRIQVLLLRSVGADYWAARVLTTTNGAAPPFTVLNCGILVRCQFKSFALRSSGFVQTSYIRDLMKVIGDILGCDIREESNKTVYGGSQVETPANETKRIRTMY